MIGGLPGQACRHDDTQRVDLQTRSSVLPRKLLAERTPTFVVVVCATRVTGGGCSMQHANALLLLCCIAQRPDIEAETRVVVRGQDADELILCYICVSHQHTCM